MLQLNVAEMNVAEVHVIFDVPKHVLLCVNRPVVVVFDVVTVN